MIYSLYWWRYYICIIFW